MDSNEHAKFLLEFCDKKVDEYRNPEQFDCPCCGNSIPSAEVVSSHYVNVRICRDCCLAEERLGGPKPYEDWFQIHDYEQYRAEKLRVVAEEVSECQKTPCTT